MKPKIRVLIVEDETIVARDLQNMVEKVGYEVCGLATTGEEALELASSRKPDLALVDIVIKGSLDGIEIAKKDVRIAELEFEELLRNLKLQLHTSFYVIHQYYNVIKKLDYQLSILDTLIQSYEIQARKGNLLLKDAIRLKTVYFKINSSKSEFSVIMLDEMKRMQLLLHNSDFIVADVAEDTFNTFNKIKPLEELLNDAVSNRPDYGKITEESASASLNYSLQKKMIIPDVTLNTSYDQHGGAIPNQINMGISMPIPSWNLNRGNIMAARINVKTSQIMIENKMLEIEADVVNAWRNHMRCCDEFKKLNQYYSDDFNVVFEGMNANFQKGNVTILEFVDFIESYNESLNEMERIKTQLAISAARVNYYTATNVY